MSDWSSTPASPLPPRKAPSSLEAATTLRAGAGARTTLLLGGVACVALSAVSRWLLLDFPNSADEYAYLWQAQAFSQGHLTAAVPEPRDAFAFFHLGDVQGVRFSRFPTGWPLLLTPGVWLGLPGLVNPLLSALALMGMHRLGLRSVGEKAALLGCLLVLVSPFFLLTGASYHSHPASLALEVGLACVLLLSSRAPDEPDARRRWALAGLLFGMGVLVRPFTGLLLGSALVGWALWERLRESPPDREGSQPGEPLPWGTFFRRYWSQLLAFGAGGLPCALWLMLTNRAITGSFWLLPTRLVDPEEGLGFGFHGHTLTRGLQNTLLWSIEALAYTFFMTPFLLFLARGQAGRRERLWWGLLLLPIVGYVFYWNPGGNRYGPRFWYEALLPFGLLVGVGVMRVWSLERYRILVALFALIGVLGCGKLLADAHAQVWARSAVYRAMAQEGLLKPGASPSVVLLLGSSGTMPVYDLARNPPAFESEPVLLGRGRGELDREVAARWPDRALYYYRWDEKGGKLFRANLDAPETPDKLPDL